MKCEELLKLLSDYVDGQIDPGLCTELEKHLGGCNPCRVVVDNLRRTIELYKDDQLYELPTDFKARLHETLKGKWCHRPSGGASA